MPYKNPLTPEQKQRQKEVHAEWYAANKERLLAAGRERYKQKKDIVLAQCKERYLLNKDEKLLKRRLRRSSNVELAREKERLYRANNREKCNEKCKAYKQRNKDKVKETQRIWREKNKDRVKVYWQSRRIRNAGDTLSFNIVERLKKLQRGRCACCGDVLGNDYELDHIMPLALGGSNTDENIQLLRKTCNRQKNAKHPIDFMQQRGFLL